MWTASVNIFSDQIKNFLRNLRNLIVAIVGCLSELGMFSSNSKKKGYSVEKVIFFGFERNSEVLSDLVQKLSCGPLPDQHRKIKLKITIENSIILQGKSKQVTIFENFF